MCRPNVDVMNALDRAFLDNGGIRQFCGYPMAWRRFTETYLQDFAIADNGWCLSIGRYPTL
ncbi:MAG: hypothetical protein LH702_30270 [Phormidesmis sp. CAN_BIN44]|nr:hypothetical protein [Phormidesmis sp. CAN_BIN44]